MISLNHLHNGQLCSQWARSVTINSREISTSLQQIELSFTCFVKPFISITSLQLMISSVKCTNRVQILQIFTILHNPLQTLIFNINGLSRSSRNSLNSGAPCPFSLIVYQMVCRVGSGRWSIFSLRRAS